MANCDSISKSAKEERTATQSKLEVNPSWSPLFSYCCQLQQSCEVKVSCVCSWKRHSNCILLWHKLNVSDDISMVNGEWPNFDRYGEVFTPVLSWVCVRDRRLDVSPADVSFRNWIPTAAIVNLRGSDGSAVPRTRSWEDLQVRSANYDLEVCSECCQEVIICQPSKQAEIG